MSDHQFPDIPPIDITASEAQAIERQIDDVIGAMEPGKVAQIARRLDEATAGHQTVVSYVQAVARVIGPIIKGILA